MPLALAALTRVMAAKTIAVEPPNKIARLINLSMRARLSILLHRQIAEHYLALRLGSAAFLASGIEHVDLAFGISVDQ